MKNKISLEQQKQLLERAQSILSMKEKIFKNDGSFGRYANDVQKAIEEAAQRGYFRGVSEVLSEVLGEELNTDSLEAVKEIDVLIEGAGGRK